MMEQAKWSEPSNNNIAIAHAFGRAAPRYDQHAAFQRQVGHQLLAWLPEQLTGWRILDLGCGKGILLYEIMQLLPGIKVQGLEISSEAIYLSLNYKGKLDLNECQSFFLLTLSLI